MQLAKTLVLVCTLAVLALPLAGVGDASAQNLLLNPGFESGDLTGWLVFGTGPNATVTVQSPDNGPSQPGTHNAFLDNRAETLSLTLKQSTPAGSVVGGTVSYSFDLKLGQADLGGVFFVEVFAEQAGGGVVAGSGVLGNFTPADWTTYAGSFEAPANTDFLTIQLSAITGAVAGGMSSMHVDNVSLEGARPVQVEATSWGRIRALHR
jgi:hypothetical protein